MATAAVLLLLLLLLLPPLFGPIQLLYMQSP
jgi:hypothetical protein